MLITDEESEAQGQPVGKVSKCSPRRTAEERKERSSCPLGRAIAHRGPPRNPRERQGDCWRRIHSRGRAEGQQALKKPTGEDVAASASLDTEGIVASTRARAARGALGGPRHRKHCIPWSCMWADCGDNASTKPDSLARKVRAC